MQYTRLVLSTFNEETITEKRKTKQKETAAVHKKKKVNKGKQRSADEFIIEESTVEYVDIAERTAEDSLALAARGTTTAHLIKSMNEFLDFMALLVIVSVE